MYMNVFISTYLVRIYIFLLFEKHSLNSSVYIPSLIIYIHFMYTFLHLLSTLGINLIRRSQPYIFALSLCIIPPPPWLTLTAPPKLTISPPSVNICSQTLLSPSRICR